MGLKEEPPSRGSDLGTPEWDNRFDFALVSAQEAYEHICTVAVTRRSELMTRKQMCFVNDFRIFLKSRGEPGYPLPGDDIHKFLKLFIGSGYGKDYRDHVGFTADGSRVRWLKAKFYTDLPRDMPASDAWKWLTNWDTFIEEQNDRFKGSGTGKMFHTSSLWVRAETEERLIQSTLFCAAFSVLFALVAVTLFLGNVALAVYLILGIICVIICLAGIMFGIMGWKFGAVEAVGLIVFVGFSVDYSLHMAESYSQSKEIRRMAKVQDAVRRTGGAVFAAAVTSALAGFPILLCTIQVFVKFGVTIVLNTFLSLFFSLGFLVALLMLIGPVNNFGSCNVICDAIFGKRQRLDANENVIAGEVAVAGTVVGVSPGAAGYSWQGGAPSAGDPKKGAPDSGGYKWDYDDSDDPKKGVPASSNGTAVAPPQLSLVSESEAAAAAEAEEENPNPVLQEPTRVSTPTRGSTPNSNERAPERGSGPEPSQIGLHNL
jgi:hypothetical protein